MKKCNLASIDSIETAGMLDGPGIRTIVFFNGCKLRCKYCHNPETWKMGKLDYDVEKLFNKIIRNKPYFKNGGGVTLSGGEPLLQKEFIIELCKKLKDDNIHIALDTAGVGNGNYEELLSLVDLVIMDVKHVDYDEYLNLTGVDIKFSLEFFDTLIKNNKNIWIRQVIIPGYNDNKEYVDKLIEFLRGIPNIEKVEFLPYHSYGKSKYKELNIKYIYENMDDMNFDDCELLYQYFCSKYYI